MEFSIINANNQTDILNKQISLIGKGMGAGRKQCIIVPDKFSLSMEQNIMEKLGLSASMDFWVYTFATFSEKMLSNSAKVLSSLGATYVIQMLLNKHKGELKCFSKTNKTINFASVIFDNISQMKSCGVSVAALKNASEKIKNKLLSAKLADIAFIYEKYEEYLGNDFVDSANRLTLLSEELANNKSLENTDVHICYFDSLTAKNLDVVKNLIKCAKSVSVGAVVPKMLQNNKFVYNTSLMESFLDVAKELEITPNIIEADETLTLEQKQIINNLMGNSPEVLELKQNNIKPMVCASVAEEVNMLAMDVASMVKSGARYKDFVVNCTSLENYAPSLRNALENYDIPYWIDLPFNICESEFCKFVNTTFALISNNFLREDIIKFSKNIFSGVDSQKQMVFENVVNRYGIEFNSLWQNFSVDDEEYAVFLDVRNSAFKPVKTFANNIKICKTIGEFVVSLQNFLKEVGIDEKTQLILKQNNEQNDLWNESINRQVGDRFGKSLDVLYDVMAEYETNFDDFCSILNAGLNSVKISPLPMALDCVYVGQNLQSVFQPAENLYVLGACDGAYPAMVSDVGMISDLDIAELLTKDVDITPTVKEVNTRSVFQVIQNTAMFTKCLHISYPLKAEDGQHLPSTAFLSLKQIFTLGGEELKTISAAEFLQNNSSSEEEQNKLIYTWGNLKNALSSTIIESNNPVSGTSKNLLATTIKVLKENGFLDVFEALEETGTVLAKKKNLKTNIIKDKTYLSVTELERYFQCPYQHFVDYGLKLKENETSNISSIDNGNIIHAVLEKFVLYYKKKQNMQLNEVENVVNKIFLSVLKEPEFQRFQKTSKNAFSLKKLNMECVNACKAVLFQLDKSNYKVLFVEKSFGSSDFVPMPEIAVLNKKIKIRGKVDRLDVCEGTYRIIDYKTSKNASSFSLLDLYLGKKIQLFFYLYSILEGLKAKGKQAKAGGVYYFPVHREYSTEPNSEQFDGFRMEGITESSMQNIRNTDGTLSQSKLKSSVVDLVLGAKFFEGEGAGKGNKLASNLELNAILNYSNNIALKAINEICEGFVEPKPLDGVCDYCAYKHICKISCSLNPLARAKNYKIDIQSFGEIENETTERTGRNS